jgi:uncharacterized protein
MDKPIIMRQRYIPFETIDISGDEILFRDDELLITKWKAIKPRSDLFGGISFTFLKEGYKISKFFDKDENFLFWYCDIIEVKYEAEYEKYTLIDLLVDVKIFPHGEYRVLDVDELAEALEKNLVSKVQVNMALNRLDKLLQMIYNNMFPPEVCLKEEFIY